MTSSTMFSCVRSVALLLAVAACGGHEQPAANSRTAPSAAPAPAPNPSDVVVRGTAVVSGDHALIQSGAVGPLSVGMWRRQAMSLVYPVGAAQGAPGEDLIVVRGIGRDTLTLAFVDDTLRRVLVTRPGPHTADSIGVGTPLSKLTAIPGAHVGTTGGAERITVPKYCGVEFSSAADTSDRQARGAARQARGANVVRSIVVGPCVRASAVP